MASNRTELIALYSGSCTISDKLSLIYYLQCASNGPADFAISLDTNSLSTENKRPIF